MSTPIPTPILAEITSADAVVQLVRIKCHKSAFDSSFVGSRHLLHVSIDHGGPAGRGTPQVGRYAQEGSSAFSPMGAVMFRPAGLCVEARGIAPSRALQCWLSDERLAIVKSVMPDWTEDRLTKMLDIRSREIGCYMARLLEEAVRPGFASAAVADAMLVLALSDIAAFLSGHPAGAECDASDRDASDHTAALRKVIERIYDLADETPSVGELAAIASMSERRLLLAFRKANGRSLISCIKELRLQRAQHYLTLTDIPLKQVAAKLGFSSQANFTTAFRREVHSTPKTYRRDYRTRIASASAPTRGD